MAGIDCIGGQVLPQGEWDGPYGIMGEHSGLLYHYILGRTCSSMAAIDPGKQGRFICEIFGNCGWEEGVRQKKYLADHFLVQSINYFVHMRSVPRTSTIPTVRHISTPTVTIPSTGTSSVCRPI